MSDTEAAVTVDVSDAASDVASRPLRIVFFEDRAEVTRVATLPLSLGIAWRKVGGLSTAAADASLEAAMSGGGGGDGATIRTARVLRRVREESHVSLEAHRALEAAYFAAAELTAGHERRTARLSRRSAEDHALVADFLAWLATVPTGFAKEGASWRIAYEALITDLNTTLGAWYEAYDAARKARKETELAGRKLREAEATSLRLESVVELECESPREGPFDVELKYRVPCALWRPEHVATVRQAGGSAHVELVTLATVWQKTGEAWDDVEVELSTARPQKIARVPLLSSDVLTLRTKTEEEKQRVVVEVREQAIATLGGGGRDAEEMPGVDDGGRPVSFKIKDKAHIPSDGRPVRLEIGRVTLPCTILRVVWPELSQAAYYRATATWTGSTPLLAGPLHVTLDDVAAGRQKMKLVAPGEAVEMSCGTDDAVSAQRVVERKSDTGMLGGQRRLRSVTVYVANTSNERKPVRIIERIPVSEIEGLEVALVAGEGWKVDADGLLSSDVQIPAGTTQRFSYAYELRASGKVVLPDA